LRLKTNRNNLDTQNNGSNDKETSGELVITVISVSVFYSIQVDRHRIGYLQHFTAADSLASPNVSYKRFLICVLPDHEDTASLGKVAIFRILYFKTENG
jgi:hypothetical protein